MSEYTIYHNPRCSKSRQTLQLLQEKGIEPNVVLYLETVPSIEELSELVAKLGTSVRDLIRTGEDVYKENNLKDPSISDEELLAKMVEFPKLIQRPVVVKGDKAVMGRPPENVLELI